MSDLTEFLLARIAEDEAADGSSRVLPNGNGGWIVELHESWPVLIQTEPKFEMNTETLVAKMTSEIAWMTNAEYVKRFGTDPPTAPMLLALAQPYADHPDFRPEWRV